MAGTYTVTVTSATGCISVASTDVSISSLPVVTITSSSNPICIYDTRILTANPEGGTFTVTGGPGNLAGNVLQPSGTGEIGLSYSFTDICTNLAIQSILVIDKPVAVAGHDQELQFVFETKMDAELSSSETGIWSLLSGSGKISDIYSPVTGVTDLSIGKNVFLWTVQNSLCEASAEVTLTVFDLFIPSVITPNGDGKNDKFKLSALGGHVELIIFNRWGNVEYDNSNYLNDWEGQNDKGAPLPNDTYLYVIRFENGTTRNGTVLITR
jgi:gliding motility-associated-like protein